MATTKWGISPDCVYIIYTLLNVLLCDVEIYKSVNSTTGTNMRQALMNICANRRSSEIVRNLFFNNVRKVHMFCSSLMDICVLAYQCIV